MGMYRGMMQHQIYAICNFPKDIPVISGAEAPITAEQLTDTYRDHTPRNVHV